MEDRLLTICGQYNASDKKVPQLILKGIWFEDAGFKIGDRVTVSVENGKLVIENKGKEYGKPYKKEKSHPARRRMGLN